MKNTLSVIFDKSMIVMDRTFAKLAANTNSKEYEKLQQVRRDYPNFVVTMRKIKKSTNKTTYKGLTYDYMREYILSHGSSEKKGRCYDEFITLMEISLCHSQSKRYPTIKKWFLENYPEIAEFGIEPKASEPEYEIFDEIDEQDAFKDEAEAVA